MNWVLIANPYPYEPRTDYFSLGITLLGLILIIIGTWKLYKIARSPVSEEVGLSERDSGGPSK